MPNLIIKSGISFLDRDIKTEISIISEERKGHKKDEFYRGDSLNFKEEIYRPKINV